MTISAAQVKELRDKTGAGMMDCKKALMESGGDFNKAIENLRKKGASVASKRSEKTANEGLVLAHVEDDNTAVIVEVNCETDFVAKSADFVKFADFVLKAILEKEPANIDELMNTTLKDKSVSQELNDIMGKVGEKVEISRFSLEKVPNGLAVGYVHHGSKLGVLVTAENVTDDNKVEFGTLLRDIAMQAAAMKPLFVYREEVPTDTIEKEIDIYKEIARKEGKPETILEKIALGKLNKYYQENCLIEQAYIKDNTKNVGDLIKEFNKLQSAEIKLKRFLRYHLSDENK